MKIVDSWLNDLPQQFLEKKNIEALIRAFSKQLQEIQSVFNDLNNLTDIDNAIGMNLDMIGNIVSLSRKDATAIIRKTNDYALEDKIYRQVLKYKILKNSSNCTYEDIMGAVSLLWNTNNIIYREPPERPATVLLSLSTVSLDSIDHAVGRVLAIKSGGVAIIYTIGYWDVVPLYLYEKFFISKMELLWKVMFYEFAMKGVKKLNGVWFLDGSVLLNGALIEIPFFMRNHSITTVHTEHILCSLIIKKNFWCLNGSQLLDGNRYLNAIEIKEVI